MSYGVDAAYTLPNGCPGNDPECTPDANLTYVDVQQPFLSTVSLPMLLGLAAGAFVIYRMMK